MRVWLTRLGTIKAVLKETFAEYMLDKAPMMGAAVAFYAILALAPLLVLVVSVLGTAFGEVAVRASMTRWIQHTFDGAAAQLCIEFLEGASAPGATTLPGVVGLVLTVYYATRLFFSLQVALNHVWNVEALVQRGTRKAVVTAARQRGFAFLLMLAFGALLLLSLALDTALSVVARTLSELPGFWALYRVLVFVGSSVLMGAGVGIVWMLLPDAKLRWRYVWRGALFTGVMLVLGKLLLGFYLGSSVVLSASGAAGSVFAMLAWIYFSAQVFFFGAELTQVVARRAGHDVRLRTAPPTERSPNV
jgi:membrane protein